MAYQPSSFVWYEINTPDPEASRKFYSDVIGWNINDVDMGPAGMYPMIHAGEAPLGGVTAVQDGVPSHWNAYLAVADVDATIEAVKTNDGNVLFGPQDIPGVGRFALVADPQGASFSIFTSADPEAANLDGAAQRFHWTELWATDVDAVLPFYTEVFGFDTETMEMPTGTYQILIKDGVRRGGIMASPAPEAPAHWVPWVQVEDVDRTLTKALSKGAAVAAEAFEVPGVRRCAVIVDTTGATLGVITPEAK